MPALIQSMAAETRLPIRSGLRVPGALPAPRDGKDLSGTRQMKRVTESNIVDLYHKTNTAGYI